MNPLQKLASFFTYRRSASSDPAAVTAGHLLTTHCSQCGAEAVGIYIWEQDGAWKLRFTALGVNLLTPGPTDRGDPISSERAQAILAAFQGPDHDEAKIAAAGFWDDAGFCRPCGKFYCAAHWNISSTGLGTCPAGHSKSFDPHWHPDWDDL